MIPKTLKKRCKTTQDQIEKLEFLLNSYKKDIEKLNSKKIENKDKLELEEVLKYKYVFNNDLLDDPYNYINVEQEKCFTKKKVINTDKKLVKE